MRLINAGFEVLTVDNKPITRRKGLEALRFIEKVARTCYKSEDKIGRGTAERLVKNLINRGHEAMLEFYDIVVKLYIDTGVSHEAVRQRLCSFAQESSRYCNYGKKGEVTFVVPPWVKIKPGIYSSRNIDELINGGDVPDTDCEWLALMFQAETSYLFLLEQGWTPQQARDVLPKSLKTELVVKCNIREWRHIFGLRTSNAAHPQMTEVMRPLLEHLRSVVPIVFDDVGSLV